MKSTLTLIFTFIISLYLMIHWFDNKISHSNKDEKIETRRKYNNKLYPTEWDWLQRTFPYYKSDPDVYKEALKKVKEMRKDAKNLALKKNSVLENWQFAGPNNIGGRVVDIEFNPSDPNIVYAGAATGGVYKSTDKGVTWFSIFDDISVFTIGDIAIDPSNRI